ncbi:MAG: hypothetical protein IKV31_01995 [Paludibacteraceae bacterium]|nr:hypothetical protein [Paludibacteraceae bacterium]
MKKSVLFFGVVALVCSCSTPKATSYSYSEYKTISPTQSVMYTIPLLADLDVAKERITYGERINQNISTLTTAEVEALALREKETVIANALRANNADVLVAPNVSIETDANKNLVIVVTGYPAVYKNFRNITKEDEWVIDKVNAEQSKEKEKNVKHIGELFKKK